MKTQRTKIAGYAFPSSSISEKINHGKGCYYLALKLHPMDKETAHMVFESLEEAIEYGNKLDEPWDRYSLPTPKGAL